PGLRPPAPVGSPGIRDRPRPGPDAPRVRGRGPPGPGGIAGRGLHRAARPRRRRAVPRPLRRPAPGPRRDGGTGGAAGPARRTAPGVRRACVEKQLTFRPCGHILTNAGVWSPDGKWVVYDTRSDPAGCVFDGTRIERVHAETGAVRVLYESRNGACCGVATC